MPERIKAVAGPLIAFLGGALLTSIVAQVAAYASYFRDAATRTELAKEAEIRAAADLSLASGIADTRADIREILTILREREKANGAKP